MNDSQTDRIANAFLYAFAPHDLARTRWQLTQSPRGKTAGPNQFMHSRRLLDHRARVVTMPNNDTLYSSAWLDLSQGPISVQVPDMGDRYYSLAFMDAFTNNFACVSRRTHGGAARILWIAAPGDGQAVPAGALRIDAPSTDVWLLARLLIDGVDDLPAVRALQDALVLQTQGPGRPFETVPDEQDPAAFVNLASEALGRNATAEPDPTMFDRLRSVGIDPGNPSAWSDMSPSLQEAWRSAYPDLREQLRWGASIGVTDPVSRWAFGLDHLGRYGDDHGYRAFIALTGLGALERAEAIYATTQDDADGQPLDGGRAYEFRMPGDLPIGAFWSLSMYQFEADGRAFFVENALNRFTIGDRTPGIRRDADGAIRILMQHDAPAAEQASNWLPAPKGRFMLALRLYEPGPPLLDRRYVIPAVRPLAGG